MWISNGSSEYQPALDNIAPFIIAAQIIGKKVETRKFCNFKGLHFHKRNFHDLDYKCS